MSYSLSDLLIVLLSGLFIGSCLVYILCAYRHNKLPKENALVIRHILSYASPSFKQMNNNKFPIENDPFLSVRFHSWAAVNLFTKKMIELLEKW